MGTELDQTRLAALHQAAHDLKGNAPAEEVVRRAQTYLAYLVVAPDEGAQDHTNNLTYVLQVLYASEINAGLSSFWDGGFSVWIGDDSNGKDEVNFDASDLWRAARWLASAACHRYPDSQFAKAFGPKLGGIYGMTTDTTWCA